MIIQWTEGAVRAAASVFVWTDNPAAETPAPPAPGVGGSAAFGAGSRGSYRVGPKSVAFGAQFPSGFSSPQALALASGSVPFTPASLAALDSWYDASQETAYANNDPVGTITDRGPGGYHLSTAGGARSTYKTGIVNGKPVYRFDGVGNDYQFRDVRLFTQGSIYFVLRATGVMSNCLLFSGGGVIPYYPFNATPDLYESFGVTVRQGPFAKDPSITLSVAHIYGVSVSTLGTLIASQNGITILSVGGLTVGWQPLAATIRLGRGGGGDSWAGDIAEIILCSAPLSVGDEAALLGYLNSKYMLY